MSPTSMECKSHLELSPGWLSVVTPTPGVLYMIKSYTFLVIRSKDTLV